MLGNAKGRRVLVLCESANGLSAMKLGLGILVVLHEDTSGQVSVRDQRQDLVYSALFGECMDRGPDSQ